MSLGEARIGSAYNLDDSPQARKNPMQIGITACLRDLAARCDKIARQTVDPKVTEALGAISAELVEKAEAVETAFCLCKEKRARLALELRPFGPCR